LRAASGTTATCSHNDDNTTLIDEHAINALASVGDSEIPHGDNTPAAIGMHTTL
jgi:hypothetical protein